MLRRRICTKTRTKRARNGQNLEAVLVVYGAQAFTTAALVDVLEGNSNVVAALPDDLSTTGTSGITALASLNALGKLSPRGRAGTTRWKPG